MGNKIIIDEEVLAKLDAEILELEKQLKHHKEFKDTIAAIQTKCTLLGLEQAKKLTLENSTTISIDESIEERAHRYAQGDEYLYTAYMQIATEQSIIYEIKSKDWISVNKRVDIKGGKYLVYDPNWIEDNKIRTAFYRNYNGIWIADNGSDDVIHPTFYMPLPTKP
jgi:hypothetical protein